MKTIQQLSVDYLEWRRLERGGSPVSRSYRHAFVTFTRWLEEIAEVRYPSQLTSQVIGRWLQYESTRLIAWSQRPLSRGSFQTECFYLARFCEWLGSRGYVPVSIRDAFPKLRRLPVRRKTALKYRQMRRLLNGVRVDSVVGCRDRALFEFLYTTGVRIAEALAIDLPDLDLDNGLVRVLGKGMKHRMVPIGRGALRFLRFYLSSARTKLLRSPAEQAVWLGLKGSRLHYDVFYLHARKLFRSMGLPINVTAHTFRRSFATELHRHGASLWEIKELLGHRKIGALKFYLDLRVEDLKRTHAHFHPRDLPSEGASSEGESS